MSHLGGKTGIEAQRHRIKITSRHTAVVAPACLHAYLPVTQDMARVGYETERKFKHKEEMDQTCRNPSQTALALNFAACEMLLTQALETRIELRRSIGSSIGDWVVT